jgi:DNA helicase-2/ATP-dependent DNA helicase PcrA
VAHNRERFAKRIRASPRAHGSLVLAPDSGDAVARARRLLATWATASSADGTTRAVLARTNEELVPYAAVALEVGLPFDVASDGLLLDVPELLAAVDMAGAASPSLPLLPLLGRVAREAGLDASATSTLLGWGAAYPDAGALREALAERTALRARFADGSPGPALTLATMHGTKGLEWDHVACIGHDEGAFPSGRALREADDPVRVLEEERRLAYVAWTRARHTLTIVHDPAAPSTFLREAFDPAELA